MSVTHVNLARLLLAKAAVEMSQDDDDGVTARKRNNDPLARGSG